MAEGISDTITTASALGVATSSRCTAVTVSVAKDGASTIACTLAGTSSIEGKKIQWSRTADVASTGVIGTWTCKTDVATEFRPKTCQTAI